MFNHFIQNLVYVSFKRLVAGFMGGTPFYIQVSAIAIIMTGVWLEAVCGTDSGPTLNLHPINAFPA